MYNAFDSWCNVINERLKDIDAEFCDVTKYIQVDKLEDKFNIGKTPGDIVYEICKRRHDDAKNCHACKSCCKWRR